MTAFLVGALVPAVSAVLAWASGDEVVWVEVCTPSGTRLVPLSPDEAAREQGIGGSGVFAAERCPFCFLDKMQVAFLPTLGGVLSKERGPEPHALDRYVSPTLPFVATVSLPRAPPALV